MRLKTNLLFLLLFLSLSLYAQVDTTRYSFVLGEKIAGKHLIWKTTPNSYHFFLEYNDRGRGERLNVNVQTNDKGLITLYEAKGHNYYKAPVDESFKVENGIASWHNEIENEQRPFDGKSIYSPMNSVPGSIELILHFLQSQPNHEALRLPTGNIRAVHTKNHTETIDGVKVELELWSFYGAGGPPSMTWFTPNKKFFASISGWVATIEVGYENLVDELKKIQDDIESAYFTNQAKTFTEKQKDAVAFKNVNVFDAVKGKIVKGQTVIVEKDRITQVGKASKVKVPAGAKVIDGSGKTLLPGLWDNHSHYFSAGGLYHLAAGVTNIKDLGNSLDLPETKSKINNDELLGPDISVMSGFIDFAGPFAGPTGKIVKSLEEGKSAVNFYADKGYQQIKLYSSIPPEWVKPLAEEAHRRGLQVCGHIPSHMIAEKAVQDGYDQIIHMNMILLNFMGDSLDTRSMARFVKVAERAHRIDLNSAAVKNFIHLLKSKNTVIDPTLTVFEGMFTDIPGKPSKSYEAVLDNFPPSWRRTFYDGGLPGAKDNQATYAASFAQMPKMTKLLYDNGITIVPGTDAFAGFALHRELELYSAAGIPNAQVLKSATYTSAKVAKMDNDYGTIQVGKKANLILVDGNPVESISNIRRVELTMKNGNLYNPKAMYESYGFRFWK